MKKIEIYDTTLRDGAQGEGISFSGVGKIRVAKILDELGVDYIEGGYAASNPKDMEFFHAIGKEKLRHARVAAFGSTRRANIKASEDPGTLALIEAGTPVVTLFGKSWAFHVHEVLRTTEEENRAMIFDTVRFLKENNREVIYDAEHFFDGYKDSPAHALATLKAARDAGADRIVLCDTNGGTPYFEVGDITREVIRQLGGAIGIHTHNDSELGVANSLEAIRAGAMHVQGTINGFGERCGNANLCSIIPNLALKMGYTVLSGPEKLKQLKAVADFVYEMANVRPNDKAAFVGHSAFAHKAGMHVDGVNKNPQSFEHIPPESVGNQRRVLISELSGASNVFLKAVEMGLEVDKKSPEVKAILNELEQMEKKGYEFEAAEASFKLLIQKVLKAHKPFFSLEAFRVIVEKRHKDDPCISEATVKLRINGNVLHTVGEGDGPVDALNDAMRKALSSAYPGIGDVHLVDYRVRILDPEEATAAKTRVLIESSDGEQTWGTVGVSTNIIEASWEALVDSVEYKLFLEEQKKNSAS
ncbi:MAG TPA: citramalate synthase [Kiritimatiellia bacterium]|nr:citramalate synthase [Kiritimatiellia bacterium]HMO98429.1 citramalate synthase [Kiritimatiellia bacterium]HMP95847.1 citramalate synthase [Kiritimatiellia bacterium]